MGDRVTEVEISADHADRHTVEVTLKLHNDILRLDEAEHYRTPTQWAYDGAVVWLHEGIIHLDVDIEGDDSDGEHLRCFSMPLTPRQAMVVGAHFLMLACKAGNEESR